MMRRARPQAPAQAHVFAGTGHRMTKQRQQVIAALRLAGRYLTARGVAERLRAKRPRIGLATIYRTLEALRQLGLVATSTSAQAETAYLWCASDHHHHAICSRCGRVADVPCKALPDYERMLSRGLGFAVTGHQLEFFGVCARCS